MAGGAGDSARQETTGDILVFLPGAAEIRRAQRECQPLAASGTICSCSRSTAISPPAEQDRAVSPASQRKVILSTNVAESSITVEGVTAVIDSGLARIASDSPWTGLPTLEVGAHQQSLRHAARRPRRAHCSRPRRSASTRSTISTAAASTTPPEISRRELSELCLTLRAMGIRDPLRTDLARCTARRRCLARRGFAGTSGRHARPRPPDGALSVASAPGASGDRSRRSRRGRRRLRALPPLSAGARANRATLMSLLDSEFDPVTERHFEQIRRIVRPSETPRTRSQRAAARRSSPHFPIAWRAAARTINCCSLPAAPRCSDREARAEFPGRRRHRRSQRAGAAAGPLVLRH